MEKYEGMLAIHGDLFEVDKSQRLLKGQRACIKWGSGRTFDLADGYLAGMYNTRDKEFYPYTKPYMLTREKYIWAFFIPQTLLTGTDRPTAAQVIRFNQQSLLGHHGYAYIDGLLSRRIENQLPIYAERGIVLYQPAKVNYVGMFVIHGDLFELDTERKQLFEMGKLHRAVHLDGLKQQQDAVYGRYSSRLKRIYGQGITLINEEQLSWFILPMELIQGFKSLNPAIIEAYNRSSLAEQMGFQYVDQALSNRLNGELPLMQLGGKDYVVDICRLRIYRKDNPEQAFHFRSVDMYEPSEKYFDTLQQLPVSLEHRYHQLIQMPDQVVAMSFPRLHDLDLIGFAGLCGLAPTALICNYDWKIDPEKIKIVPLIKTAIPEMIRRNQIEKEVQGPPAYNGQPTHRAPDGS
ncbi:hypothetical protein [Chitinophaga sp. Ak27]|uniref:hypothetical protein n=1 Tax=Chitinophaga sp. Ak27 TaxID=2726116 RepID=UPI00145ECAE7|nr:hypothetical protein [Chitinophaga sp. Ak27]NLU94853.1 hypothetical protein [Chitinophaga sp. Ak27]